MQFRIDLITILTDDVPRMVNFYRDVLGFETDNDTGPYVEFKSEGVRFSICARSVMREATGSDAFDQPVSGQSFELAFPLATPNQVDEVYAQLVSLGAAPVKGPADMPWNQRTAFFADPDGNIHELFAELPGGG